MAPIIFELATWQSILLCLLFAIIYVGSLYVWVDSVNKNRDHPETIKQRFVSVAIISVIVPPLLWWFGQTSNSEKAHTIFEWLGIRFSGIVAAYVLPLLLTMVLFAGPLALHYMDGVFRLYLDSKYWTTSFQNLIWIRNHVAAPFSEEFIFRACMLPLLVPAVGTGWAVFLCPFFFGVAHFHHMIERVVQGQHDVSDALKQSLFQLFYTTVFGAYSAFLFLRTGHLMAPIIAHAFCNHMGFPAFNEVMGYQQSVRQKIIACFIVGFIAWLFLLYPLTSPNIYSNTVYDL